MVEVDQSRAACKAVSKGRLLPFERVTTARGAATVLGVRRGCVWFRVDGDDTALYWTPPELDELLREHSSPKSGKRADPAHWSRGISVRPLCSSGRWPRFESKEVQHLF